MPHLLGRSLAGVARRLPLILAVMAAIAFLALGGTRYITLPALIANARRLHELADRRHVLAPILFIIIDAAMPMALVVPSWFCTVAGGLLFGPWLGAAYALVGTTLGACGVFLAARAGLRGLAERTGSRSARFVAGFQSNAMSYLLVLRLVPVFPFTLVNVAAAIGGVKLRVYAIATMVGIFPSICIYASIGGLLMTLAQQDEVPDPNLVLHPEFLVPLIGLAVLALVPLAARRLPRTPAGNPRPTPNADDQSGP